MMTNIRPRQIRPPRWPWRNQIVNGYPYVVEREPAPWMPELVSCYDWSDLEEQPTNIPGDGYCTRDMKSIFQTAVRMYDYERLYLELSAGNNVFELIGSEMRRWTERLMSVADDAGKPISLIVIGDDIAHNGGLLMPPWTLCPLFDQYQLIRARVGGWFGAKVIYHSDGNVTEAWPALERCADLFLFQADLIQIDDPRIIDHQADLAWSSYPVKEEP